MKLSPLNLSTMPSKAILLSAAAMLAACSRNPQPGIDETGRADTTVVSDTAYRVPADTAMVPKPQPSPRTDSVGVGRTDSVGVGRDSSNVQPPVQPQPQPQVPSNPDTAISRNDSSNVLPDTNKVKGDSAMVHHPVPDSTVKADTTGR